MLKIGTEEFSIRSAQWMGHVVENSLRWSFLIETQPKRMPNGLFVGPKIYSHEVLCLQAKRWKRWTDPLKTPLEWVFCYERELGKYNARLEMNEQLGDIDNGSIRFGSVKNGCFSASLDAYCELPDTHWMGATVLPIAVQTQMVFRGIHVDAQHEKEAKDILSDYLLLTNTFEFTKSRTRKEGWLALEHENHFV